MSPDATMGDIRLCLCSSVQTTLSLSLPELLSGSFKMDFLSMGNGATKTMIAYLKEEMNLRCLFPLGVKVADR